MRVTVKSKHLAYFFFHSKASGSAATSQSTCKIGAGKRSGFFSQTTTKFEEVKAINMGGLLFGGHMAGKKVWEIDWEKKKTGQLKALAIGSPMLGMHIQLRM